MTDPASITVGVLALAGLFNNAVDDFDYIQLARNFGKDSQTAVLRLDCARLRLSRWGQAMGLDSLEKLKTLPTSFASEDDVERAKALLGHILYLFQDAQHRSKTAGASSDGDDQEAAVGIDSLPLHLRMRSLAIRRQNKSSIKQKVKWALHGEKALRRLLEDITEQVNDLIELFPAARAEQQQLVAGEVQEINSDAGSQRELQRLREAAAEEDPLLADLLQKVMQNRTVSCANCPWLYTPRC